MGFDERHFADANLLCGRKEAGKKGHVCGSTVPLKLAISFFVEECHEIIQHDQCQLQLVLLSLLPGNEQRCQYYIFCRSVWDYQDAVRLWQCGSEAGLTSSHFFSATCIFTILFPESLAYFICSFGRSLLLATGTCKLYSSNNMHRSSCLQITFSVLNPCMHLLTRVETNI